MSISHSFTSCSSFMVSYYDVPINALSLYNESVHRKEQLSYDSVKILTIHAYFCEPRNSMQYFPPNSNLLSGCQTVYVVIGNNGWTPRALGSTRNRARFATSWQHFKVADLQSYNFKIYKSLPKTNNIIRMTIHPCISFI